MSRAESDDAMSVQDILDDNGVGQVSGYQGTCYAGSKTALNALEEYADEHVEDRVITSSRSIMNAVDVDVRIQELGKTLGAHLKGATPDEFLTEVEVTKWRDTRPIKWQFERVAGEAEPRRSQRLKKPQLVREISDATGAEGARFATAERDRTSWEKAHVTRSWMRDVLEAVCESVEYQPQAVIEADDELTRRDWIDQLTQSGTTQVLERAARIVDEGCDTSWNRATLRSIHDLVVTGRDPSEVGDD